VDVRTDEGDDAAGLFIDMLRGLGAKILSRMSTSLTHIVFKSGLPSTIARYRVLGDPRPIVVGIGWVVECVERREKVDEERFKVDLDGAAEAKRRKSIAPRPRRIFNFAPDGGDVSMSESVLSEENSFVDTSFDNSTVSRSHLDDILPPLEQARRRSVNFAPKVASPLRSTFWVNEDDD